MKFKIGETKTVRATNGKVYEITRRPNWYGKHTYDYQLIGDKRKAHRVVRSKVLHILKGREL